MTMVNTFRKWRYAEDLPVFRTLLGPTRVVRGDVVLTLHDAPREFRTQWHPQEGADFTDADFALDLFALLCDDQGSPGAVCPCGDELPGGDAGELLRAIYQHCGAAGHPRPTFDR